MDSKILARYIEQIDVISKPWLLVQLRLKLLEERRSSMSDQEYTSELTALHQQLMGLGRWWQGIEGQAFGEADA